MAVSYYQQHRPREATITVSQGDTAQNQDYSGDFVCDGVADDVEIQAAETYAAALGGGIVHLKIGIYYITATVTLGNGINLRGEGGYPDVVVATWVAQGTVLRAVADVTVLSAIGGVAPDRREGVVISDLAIDGQSRNIIGIHIEDHPRMPIIERVFVFECLDAGIYLKDSYLATIRNCFIQRNVGADSTFAAALYGDNVQGIVINSTYFQANPHEDVTGHHIWIRNTDVATISLCILEDGLRHGIRLEDSTGITIRDNFFALQTHYDIYLKTCSDVRIDMNWFDSGQSTVGFSTIHTGISDRTIIINNRINPTAGRVHIEVEAGAIHTIIKYNHYLGTGAPLSDGGTGTVLPTYSMPFIQGITLISAAGNPWGWEIDLDGEYAVAWGWLPFEVQQVIRINIWAVGLVSPGVADAYMRAQFTGEAAASDEVYTTNPIDIVDKNCEENNFAANDVIHWLLDATDDADIGNLLGGDSIQFKVLHEVGAGDDIETDAIFRCVEIEYV